MIAGLILAAGESSRMGRDKALLTYRGKTFLETLLDSLRAAGVTRIAVVLGHHAEEIRQGVDFAGIQRIVNPAWPSGQTSSLQAGLRALAAGSPEAIVLALVDHPAVCPGTVRALIAAFRKTAAPVVIPVHNSRRGHPVLISRALFDELLTLPPAEGANAVLRQHRDQTCFLEVDDPGILLDVDDLESYRRLEA